MKFKMVKYNLMLWICGAVFFMQSESVLAGGNILYVNKASSPTGTGLSWASPLSTIGAALDRATTGTQIWIAKGIYLETLTIRKNGVALVGGFAGHETSPSQRKIPANATIINAKGKEDVVIAIIRTKDVRLDGLVAKGGNISVAGGILCGEDQGTVISNCVITENKGDTGGGIGVWTTTPPLIKNCIILRNRAAWGAGVWFNYDALPEYPHDGERIWSNDSLLEDCIIVDNVAAYSAGGIDLAYIDRMKIQNCIISHNRVEDPETGIGGGIYCRTASPRLINCTFFRNRASLGGGLFCIHVSFPEVINTIFCQDKNHAVHEYEVANSEVTLNNCLFHNNPQGDFFDNGQTLYSVAAQIQAHVLRASGLVDGDPLFPAGPGGTLAAAPAYDAASDTSLLSDSAMRLTPGALAGRLVELKTLRNPVAYVMGNDAVSIRVLGDLSGYARAGDRFQVLDYHLTRGSAAIDRGTASTIFATTAPSTDLEGNRRPVDIRSQGADRTGREFDIGAYELQNPWSMVQEWMRYE